LIPGRAILSSATYMVRTGTPSASVISTASLPQARKIMRIKMSGSTTNKNQPSGRKRTLFRFTLPLLSQRRTTVPVTRSFFLLYSRNKQLRRHKSGHDSVSLLFFRHIYTFSDIVIRSANRSDCRSACNGITGRKRTIRKSF